MAVENREVSVCVCERCEHEWIAQGALEDELVLPTNCPKCKSKFLELVATTSAHFKIDEISADGAFASVKNPLAAESVGAIPYIPVGDLEVWRRMADRFRHFGDEFRARYLSTSKD